MSAPLVGHSSKKKRHSRIGSLLWSWSSLFPPGDVPVKSVFEGWEPRRKSKNGFFFVATLALACDQGKGGLQAVGLIVDPGAKLCERKTLSVNEDIDLFF